MSDFYEYNVRTVFDGAVTWYTTECFKEAMLLAAELLDSAELVQGTQLVVEGMPWATDDNPYPSSIIIEEWDVDSPDHEDYVGFYVDDEGTFRVCPCGRHPEVCDCPVEEGGTCGGPE